MEVETKNIHTSSNSDVLLQGAYVQLQSQLRGWAQEGLDHGRAAERRPVREELAFRLAHLLLDFFWEAILWHLSLLGDADIRLFDVAWLTIDAEDFKTPANKSASQGNQRQMGFCLCLHLWVWFSKLWLGHSGRQTLLSNHPLRGVLSMKWILLRPSSRSAGNDCECNWEMTPKATEARKRSREWEAVHAAESKKNVQFPSKTLTSCTVLGKSFNPWTLSLSYKAEIIPTWPHCYGNNTVKGCVCLCVYWYM